MATRAPGHDEDDEEEELLQRALAEQAAREANLRTSPNKPTSVDPPKSLVLSKAAPPAKAPPSRPAPQLQPGGHPTRAPQGALQPRQTRPPVEDDDDDEVDMLSISSEDESPSGRGLKHLDANGKLSAEDAHENEWEEDYEEEPSTWKPYYKTELERRVRELRETRGAYSATQNLRERSVVDPVLSYSDDFIDPLGLGVIDVRSLTLVPKTTKGDDSSPANMTAAASIGQGSDRKRGFLRSRKSIKVPAVQAVTAPTAEDEASPRKDEAPVIRDQATREKLLYFSEKFDPKFFLSHVHQNTLAADLERAEEGLNQDLKQRNNELKKLVKENFDCFISCKNTIDDIHSKLQQIESSTEGGGTQHLSNSIKQVEDAANHAFSPLLERQAQVERIRSVQGMLQRFRTLFNLPSIIRTYISKGEYDQAIREYKKAKSLDLYSHVGILKRVLEEVDKIVQEFKETLYKSMEDPHIEAAQLETTIRLLLELEPNCDPVWHYLNVQDRKIRGLLEGCSLEHDARMDAFSGRVRDRVLSDARWKKLQVQSNKSDVDYALLLGENEKDVRVGSLADTTSNESDALLGRFIRRLTLVVVHHVPLFWRLALSIVTGKFATGTSAVGRSLSRGSTGSLSSDGSDRVPKTSHTLEEVETMVHCTIFLYESKVHAAFLQLAEANVLRPYMRDALAEVSRAYTALKNNDAAPSSAVQMLLALRTEVTKIFVLRVCSLMHTAVSQFAIDEDWVPVAAAQRTSSPYAISSLPLRFQDLLVTSLDHLTEMLERLRKDGSELHEDMILQLHQMQDTVRYTFFECFLALAGNLEKLANELAVATTEDKTEEDEEGQEWEDGFVGLLAGVEITSTHQRLLMVLSNVGFCLSTLFPEQTRKYEHVWTYEGSDSTSKGGNMATYEEVTNTLSELEKKILNHYNVAKASEILRATEACLLYDGSQWSATPPVKGFRCALMELIHPLVSTHAEVFSGAKPFLEKVINSLVEVLMDTLVAVFNDNKNTAFFRFDINGYCQLMLELEYVQTVLEGYLTPQANELAANFRALLLHAVMETVAEMTDPQNHGRGSIRGGSQDGYDYGGMTPDDLQGLAQDHIQTYLSMELERTRLNVLCFVEAFSAGHLGNRRGSQSFLKRTTYVNNASGRRSGPSSLTESDSGKIMGGLPPPIPHSGVDSPRVHDRYLRGRLDPRRPSFRGNPQIYVDNDELR
ncbi:exocyst complex component SEC5B isoform X2 [Physcomitrium patens]|uniref:exocyst complex component SEC5B isoform X2 n=1 Tax=Physcomitrium patens TaxID=3218 RepID=UPI003CCD61CB